MIFKSKLLEDGRKLSEYNVKKDDVVRQTARLSGGSPKKDRSEASMRIPNLMGNIVPEASDIPQVTAAFTLNSIDIKNWLSSRSVDNRHELITTIERNESRGLCDQSIKSYIKFVREYKQLQVAFT